MHNNGLGLKEIALMNAAETKVMISLASQSSQDSRTMRIATVIAMFYLPANLVMVHYPTRSSLLNF